VSDDADPRTEDEWRRSKELADAKLDSFDRRMAARTDLPNPDDWRGIAAAVVGAQRRIEYDLPREELVNAAEDARLGLLMATQAAEEVVDPPDALSSAELWHDPEWLSIVRAYREAGGRPSQVAVASVFGWETEQPLRDRLRPLGIDRWAKVHALVAAGPPSEAMEPHPPRRQERPR
jgi:hypothetical protein